MHLRYITVPKEKIYWLFPSTCIPNASEGYIILVYNIRRNVFLLAVKCVKLKIGLVFPENNVQTPLLCILHLIRAHISYTELICLGTKPSHDIAYKNQISTEVLPLVASNNFHFKLESIAAFKDAPKPKDLQLSTQIWTRTRYYKHIAFKRGDKKYKIT